MPDDAGASCLLRGSGAPNGRNAHIMTKVTTAMELAQTAKAGRGSASVDGWLLEEALMAVRRPLWWLGILPLSGIVGALVAAGAFLLFFFSKWILLLAGLYWLNGESIGFWSKILFCMKIGAVVPPVVIVAYSVYVLATVLLHGGGLSALRKIRRMEIM